MRGRKAEGLGDSGRPRVCAAHPGGQEQDGWWPRGMRGRPAGRQAPGRIAVSEAQRGRSGCQTKDAVQIGGVRADGGGRCPVFLNLHERAGQPQAALSPAHISDQVKKNILHTLICKTDNQQGPL